MSNPRKRRYMRYAIAVASCATLGLGGVLLGCGDDEEPEQNNDQNNNDPPPRPDPVDDDWEVEAVPFDDEGGFQLRMAVHEGTIGLAFFDLIPRTGEPCDELEIDDPPNKIEYSLHYMERSGQGDWSQELIHSVPFVGAPPGLDLQYDAQGRAVVATMIGDPVSQLVEYCGVNDVGVLRREGAQDWNYETAVSTSGEAAAGHPSADAGYVVGYWPGLAFDSDGQAAVAYRDVHFGGIQADDFRRADLEFVHRQGGSWEPEPIDWANGAGLYNRLIFDDEDRPIIAYYTPTESNIEERLGYWVTRRVDGEWQKVQLFNRGNTEEPSIALHPQTGALHLLFYDSEFGTPRMATLEDWDNFESASAWEFTDSVEIGDPTYDEGYSPSLAISPQGTLAAAYYRCAMATQGLGDCRAEDSAVIFAHLNGDEWELEAVDEGEHLAFCGQAPTLIFDGDEPVVSYRCEVYDEEEELISTEIRLARRDAID